MEVRPTPLPMIRPPNPPGWVFNTSRLRPPSTPQGGVADAVGWKEMGFYGFDDNCARKS